MKAIDIIKLAARYIGQKDLLATTTLGGETAPTIQQTETIETLTECVCDVVETLAVMHFPLKYKEEISIDDGVLNFSDLEKSVCEVIKLEDEFGMNVEFEAFPQSIHAPKGNYTITYNFIPERIDGLNSTLEVNMEKVTPRLLTLGVVSRYYLFCGMYSDAEAWQKTFLSLVLSQQRSKRNQVIKKRRWI